MNHVLPPGHRLTARATVQAGVLLTYECPGGCASAVVPPAARIAFWRRQEQPYGLFEVRLLRAGENGKRAKIQLYDPGSSRRPAGLRFASVPNHALLDYPSLLQRHVKRPGKTVHLLNGAEYTVLAGELES